LVLFEKKGFHNDRDLSVHVRTTMQDSFSFIEEVAIKVGDDILEFHGDSSVYLNGIEQSMEMESRITFGDEYSLFKNPFNNNKDKPGFVVKMKGAAVKVRSGMFMTASIEGSDEALQGSKGILGKHGTGEMIARDGTIMSDFTEFGFEWQVNPLQGDPRLFMEARAPQLPYERCRMPSVEVSRRMLRAQDSKLMEQATEKCAMNHPKNVQSCIDDVMLTGNLELAEEW
jgi:hypothetical protein